MTQALTDNETQQAIQAARAANDHHARCGAMEVIGRQPGGEIHVKCQCSVVLSVRIPSAPAAAPEPASSESEAPSPQGRDGGRRRVIVNDGKAGE